MQTLRQPFASGGYVTVSLKQEWHHPSDDDPTGMPLCALSLRTGGLQSASQHILFSFSSLKSRFPLSIDVLLSGQMWSFTRRRS